MECRNANDGSWSMGLILPPTSSLLVIEKRLRDGNSGGGKKGWQMGRESVRSTVCQMFMQMRPYETRAYNAANARGKQRESFSEAAYRWHQFMIAPKRFHPRERGERER